MDSRYITIGNRKKKLRIYNRFIQRGGVARYPYNDMSRKENKNDNSLERTKSSENNTSKLTIYPVDTNRSVLCPDLIFSFKGFFPSLWKQFRIFSRRSNRTGQLFAIFCGKAVTPCFDCTGDLTIE